MFTRLLALTLLSTAPLLAEISYFPAQPAKLAPEELIAYKSEILELLDYDPGAPDQSRRAKALQLIRENKNDCVNDFAGHDGIEYTPLYVACQMQDAELVQAMLEQGANANHPRLQKLKGRLTPEIEQLLKTARSNAKAAPVSPEEWERRYHERIGGKLFWNANKTFCAAVTQNPKTDNNVEIWCLRADNRGKYIPIGICIVQAPGYQVEQVELSRGIMKATLSKPGIQINASLYHAFYNYLKYDFSTSITNPTLHDKLEHPIDQLPMYTRLVTLSEP